MTTADADDVLREIDAATRIAEHTDPPVEWDTPTPLGGRPALPSFPAAALPDWVAAMVTAVAEETQTPPDLAGCLALAALSTAAGGRAQVDIRGTWTEPVNLFVVVAMPPASRKSPVFRAMIRPLLRAEAHLARTVRPQIIEAELARSIAAGVAEKAKHEAISSKGAPDKVADAVDAAGAVDEVRVPVLPQLVADDVTPEVAASILHEQGGRLAVLSAEGGIFQTLAGRYSGGVPNLDLFLKGHAGDMLRVGRRERAEHVESAVLTLGLAVQPEVIAEIATGPGFRGKGLLGRFLYALPESNIGTRNVLPAPVPEEVAATYDTRLTSLTTELADWADPIRLQLSPEAAEAHLDHARTTEPRLHPESGDLGHINDWAGKYLGAVARIAALLHLAQHPASGYRIPIAAETLNAAMQLGEYFTQHALATFDHMAADPDMGKARKVLAWLHRNRPREFTARDAFRALSCKQIPRATDLAPALELLEAYGWIRSRTQPEPGRKGGRPPSPTYTVHPLITRDPGT